MGESAASLKFTVATWPPGTDAATMCPHPRKLGGTLAPAEARRGHRQPPRETGPVRGRPLPSAGAEAAKFRCISSLLGFDASKIEYTSHDITIIILKEKPQPWTNLICLHLRLDASEINTRSEV